MLFTSASMRPAWASSALTAARPVVCGLWLMKSSVSRSSSAAALPDRNASYSLRTIALLASFWLVIAMPFSIGGPVPATIAAHSLTDRSVNTVHLGGNLGKLGERHRHGGLALAW